MCVGVVPTAHQHGVEDSRLLLPLALRHHLPLPAAGEVGALGHAAHAGLGAGEAVSGTLCPPLPLPPPPRPPSSHPEADVAEQVEVLGVHAEVLHDLGVVHVVGEVLRDGEVAEAHHLLGGVDDDGAVDAGTAILGALLWEWGMVQWWPGTAGLPACSAWHLPCECRIKPQVVVAPIPAPSTLPWVRPPPQKTGKR